MCVRVFLTFYTQTASRLLAAWASACGCSSNNQSAVYPENGEKCLLLPTERGQMTAKQTLGQRTNQRHSLHRPNNVHVGRFALIHLSDCNEVNATDSFSIYLYSPASQITIVSMDLTSLTQREKRLREALRAQTSAKPVSGFPPSWSVSKGKR